MSIPYADVAGGNFSNIRNFYIKDDQAFTEDNVLVYKLYVYNIPRKATLDDLKTYFSTYGHLEHVNFRSDKRRNNKTTKMAFVHFQNAAAAARVLKTDRHHICFKRMLVKACDSWHQPGAYTNNSDFNDDCPAVGLLKINDDCLEQILMHLNLRDQIRFARTCNRMRNVFIQSSKLQHRTIKLSHFEEMTVWEIYDLFYMIGDVITRIVGEIPETNRERIVEFISKYCKNITDLNLQICELRTKHVNKLFFGINNNIVELRLSYCGLTDASIVALRKLHALKKLDLSFNFQLTGKHIGTLSETIEILSLNDCNGLQPNNIMCFLRSLKNLKELNIKECYCWSRQVGKAMSTHCKQLEVLKLDAITDDFEPVAKLPKLKRLVLFADSRDLSSILSKLVKHKSEQLEYLHIVGSQCTDKEATRKIAQLRALRTLVCPKNDGVDEKALQFLCDLQNLEEIVLTDCTQVNDTAVMRLALACHKLRQIHLQHCYFITDNLIFELIKKFKAQIKSKTYKHEGGPIHLMVDSTKINKYILNDPEYISAEGILRIYFKDSPPNMLKYDEFDDDEDPSVNYNWDDLDDSYMLDDMLPTDDDDDDDMSNYYYGADLDEDDDDDTWMFNATNGNSGMLFFMG